MIKNKNLVRTLQIFLVCSLCFSHGYLKALADETSGEGTSVESTSSGEGKDKIVILESFSDSENNIGDILDQSSTNDGSSNDAGSDDKGNPNNKEVYKEEFENDIYDDEVREENLNKQDAMSQNTESKAKEKEEKENSSNTEQSDDPPTDKNDASKPINNNRNTVDKNTIEDKKNDSSNLKNNETKANDKNTANYSNNLVESDNKNPNQAGEKENEQYLTEQKNETLVIELGPKDKDYESDKQFNFSNINKMKKIDDGPNAQRIYLHLVGVFFIAIILVVSIKFFKNKSLEK